MTSDHKIVPDPKTGVAGSAVATSTGMPGGHVLTAADVPKLIVEGSPLDEIIALDLTTPERVREIAQELVGKGIVPAERFEFIR